MPYYSSRRCLVCAGSQYYSLRVQDPWDFSRLINLGARFRAERHTRESGISGRAVCFWSRRWSSVCWVKSRVVVADAVTSVSVNLCVCMHVCTYVCVCVCVYIYIYIVLKSTYTYIIYMLSAYIYSFAGRVCAG